MKLFPAAVLLASAALLSACGPKLVNNSSGDQERRAEEEQARQQSELRERQAALDEREIQIERRERALAAASPSSQEQAPPSAPAESPSPAPEAAAADATYQDFYNGLSGYGSWIELAGYGYVWQPSATVQSPGWRPYTIGRWAFTNNGWTWVSDEPFGWITYHYGRWMRTRNLNWVWFPGPLWAPAWVSWHYGNNFVGWAPLPPEANVTTSTGINQWSDDQYNLGADDYTFIPASEFGDDDMASEAVPVDQNGPIYEESDNVTNIYFDPGAYAIVCYGLKYEFIRSKTRIPVAELRLRRSGFRAGGDNSALFSGNTLEVSAPFIVQSRTAAPAPKEVRGRISDARLISAAPTPPPHGEPLPPLFRPQQIPSAAQVRAEQAVPGTQPGASGVSFPYRPGPGVSDAEAQRERDMEVIQQFRAAEGKTGNQKATNAAEEQVAELQRTAEARAAAAHATFLQQAAAARAAAQQHAAAATAHSQVIPQQPIRTSSPSGSTPVGQGHNQQ